MDEATERKFELAAGLMQCISRNGAMVEILNGVIGANVGVIHPKGSFAKDIPYNGQSRLFHWSDHFRCFNSQSLADLRHGGCVG